jgi:hypothetical protein
MSRQQHGQHVGDPNVAGDLAGKQPDQRNREDAGNGRRKADRHLTLAQRTHRQVQYPEVHRRIEGVVA